MIAIPAVDVRDSSLARASARFSAGAERVTDALSAARAFADLGFTRLQLEDFSTGARTSSLEDIVNATDASVQVAGPSSSSDIEQLLHVGAEYVVLGTRCIEDPEWLAGVADLFPDTVLVATDVRDRRIVRRGWVQTVPLDIVDLIEDLNSFPLAGILVGGIQLEGPARHAELALVEELAERSRSPIMVSAKIRTLDDLRALEHRGAAAAVLRAEQLTGELEARVVARAFGS